MTKTINLFFIGDEFYFKTNTAMSNIYACKTYQRYDWRFVQIALAEGKMVVIKPANKKQMKWANEKLENLNRS